MHAHPHFLFQHSDVIWSTFLCLSGSIYLEFWSEIIFKPALEIVFFTSSLAHSLVSLFIFTSCAFINSLLFMFLFCKYTYLWFILSLHIDSFYFCYITISFPMYWSSYFLSYLWCYWKPLTSFIRLCTLSKSLCYCYFKMPFVLCESYAPKKITCHKI